MVLGQNGNSNFNTEVKELLTKDEYCGINFYTDDYIVNFQVDQDNNLVLRFIDSGNLFKSTESLSDNTTKHTILSGEFKGFDVEESTYQGAKVYYTLGQIGNASCAKIRTLSYDIVISKMNNSLVIYVYNKENSVVAKEMISL